jgi:hypothetical protein
MCCSGKATILTQQSARILRSRNKVDADAVQIARNRSCLAQTTAIALRDLLAIYDALISTP